MGVEEIIARITVDAEAEADRLMQAAADEEARIRREGETAARAAYETRIAEGRREAEARRRKIHARAHLAVRGGVREARETGIDACFAGAKDYLSGLPEMAEYPGVLRHLIAEGQEIVGDGEYEVFFREEDQDAAVEALAAFPEVTSSLLREESTDRRGGGVVVACRSHRCDQRFSARCERMRERLTRETAQILYGDHD